MMDSDLVVTCSLSSSSSSAHPSVKGSREFQIISRLSSRLIPTLQLSIIYRRHLSLSPRSHPSRLQDPRHCFFSPTLLHKQNTRVHHQLMDKAPNFPPHSSMWIWRSGEGIKEPKGASFCVASAKTNTFQFIKKELCAINKPQRDKHNEQQPRSGR